MSPLRKGSRCHAPALYLSQWRGWVYATFHLWDKENHRSYCNGGIFRVFRAGGFDEINRRWRNFNYANREVLDLPVGATYKKENTEVFADLPSWNDGKEEWFLLQKVTVMTWKTVEKIWIFSKNIFGESLTKCAPSGHEKAIKKRKSRDPFFKYGSLRLNDLRNRKTDRQPDLAPPLKKSIRTRNVWEKIYQNFSLSCTRAIGHWLFPLIPSYFSALWQLALVNQ